MDAPWVVSAKLVQGALVKLATKVESSIEVELVVVFVSTDELWTGDVLSCRL